MSVALAPHVAENLERAPTDAMQAAALATHGETFSKPWAPLFAYRISQGDSAQQAYLASRGSCSRSDASARAGLLLAHPAMRHMIAAHLAGPLVLVRASTVLAVEQLVWLALNAESHKVRLDAANSILDRGGVPKSTTVAIEASLSVADVLGSVLEADILELPVHAASAATTTHPASDE